MIISFLRKNIGVFVAFFGFTLLVIMTFGDLGELMTEEYWANVKENLTAITYTTIGLTMIQTAIRQGLSEQALQRGLNTEKATTAYQAHRDLIKSCVEKIQYLPYFIHNYNARNTNLKKREFLVTNGFSSEKVFLDHASKRDIRKYKSIKVQISCSSIKWATSEIKYKKNGRVETLAEHRTKRIIFNIGSSLLCMVAVAFITRGLFFAEVEEPLYEKFIKLLTYTVSIILGSILGVVKEYERGAFSVPNILDDINEIWIEFKNWNIPDWVVKEMEEIENETKGGNDSRKAVQEKQKESESVLDPEPSGVLPTDGELPSVHLAGSEELNR